MTRLEIIVEGIVEGVNKVCREEPDVNTVDETLDVLEGVVVRLEEIATDFREYKEERNAG